MKTKIVQEIKDKYSIGSRRKVNNVALCFAMAFLATVSPMKTEAEDHLLSFSLLCGLNYAGNTITPSPGGLIDIRLTDLLQFETGYKYDIFCDRQKEEVLRVSNTTFYHTIPIGLSYSWRYFDFTLGPSLHIINSAHVRVERVYKDGDKDQYDYLDGMSTTNNYNKLFCSFTGNFRYNFKGYYAVGITYGNSLTNRLKNNLFEKPFHYFGFNFYIRLNETTMTKF